MKIKLNIFLSFTQTVTGLSSTIDSISVTALSFCSEYVFYLTAYENDFCSEKIAVRWTTGPFMLQSKKLILLLSNACHK